MSPASNVGPRSHGFGHFLHKTANAIGGVGAGIGLGLADRGKALASDVAHPRRTAQGVTRLVTHPVATLDALGTDIPGPKGPDESTARKVGRAISGVGLDVLTLGGGAVAGAADTASLVADAGKHVDQVSSAGNRGRSDDDEPVRIGGVIEGAGRTVWQPARATLHAVSHPRQTIGGLRGAAGDPMGTAKRVDDKPTTGPALDKSGRVGRGILRLGGMAVGLGPVAPVADALKGGEQLDRVAGAGRK